MLKLSKEKIEEIRREFKEKDEKRLQEFSLMKKKIEDSKNFLDEDGYPTKDSLDIIEIWHRTEINSFFDFIEKVWYLKSFGWNKVVGGEDEFTNRKLEDSIARYYISTAGWSGNEAIINAMMKNQDIWEDTWVQSRRGGHYIFELNLD